MTTRAHILLTTEQRVYALECKARSTRSLWIDRAVVLLLGAVIGAVGMQAIPKTPPGATPAQVAEVQALRAKVNQLQAQAALASDFEVVSLPATRRK